METKEINLGKYNVPAPRYTSYPTVPYWQTDTFSTQKWLDKVQLASADQAGISLYIHLPYCESLCTYCGCNTRITINHRVERPYVDAVLKEWSMYRKHLKAPLHIRDIHLGGGTPTFFAPENLEDLIKGILADCTLAEDVEFSFEAHPANTTEAHLERLYRLGFRRLSLGIQDFDSKVQQIINRKQSPADVIRVMQQARKIGYTSINFDLIYGLPLQQLTGLQETLRIALAMHPDRIAFYSYAHVPWIKPGQRLFTESDLPDEYLKWDLYQTGKEIITKAGYQDIGMDHFAWKEDPLAIAATNGKLHRNFMGYTDRKSSLLIGLGVSSISDAWEAYAQNVKTVEAYLKLLANDELPVVKGHILTAEDIVIRQQLLDIMCRKELVFAHQPERIVWQRLSEMHRDGLIDLQAHKMSVTEKGKSFLRNICMAFDQYLNSQSIDRPIFSKAI